MPSSQNDVGVYSNAITPIGMGFTGFIVAVATPTPLPTLPDSVNILLLQSNEPIRYIDNGVDNPTASSGILIPANVPFQYQVTDFTLIRFNTDAGAGGNATVNVLGYAYSKAKEF